MELCSLCSKIKDIRINQGKSYYYDLCSECKKKEILLSIKDIRKKVSIII
ncbi:MAG: hypothetical protein ACOCQW_04660 [Halanaerobiaceae bacterium]